MTSLGSLALTLAFLTAVGAVCAAVASARLNRPHLLTTAVRLLTGHFACLTVASFALLVLLGRSDFSVAYVASYTEHALPLGYKLSAFWAGQEGSILFWAWVLGLITVIAAWPLRRGKGVEPAAVLGTLAVIMGFFAALMIFAADPFTTLSVTLADGNGLNPMLQHPSMLVHPPLTFIGYAGYTIPFALLIGALVAGRRDQQWIASTRRWLLFSWLLLGAGIVVGGQWAYMELGWGGYWAWDPVENASLLPWLTGTAVLHTVIMQRSRGQFRQWNAWLITWSFVLCIFATYLTRSGVVQSVHAFGQSNVGTFFLSFLLASLAAGAALIFWRRDTLKPTIQTLDLRGKVFLVVVTLLVIMTLATGIGTIFPILSAPFAAEPITVDQPFYNTVVAPLMLVLVGLMAIAPLLKAGPRGWENLLRRIHVPVIAAAVAAVIVVILGWVSLWSIAVAAIAGFAFAALALDLAGRYRTEQTQPTPRPMSQVLVAQRSRYGGMLAHVGVILMAIGIVGSSVFNTSETVQLRPGETTTVADYTLTYRHLHQDRGPNHTAVQAHMDVARGDQRFTLHPQLRFYDKSDKTHAKIALRTRLDEDLYITLAGWDEGGQVASFRVTVNPLVLWIWIGGIVCALGFVFAWLPWPRTVTVAKAVPAPAATSTPTAPPIAEPSHA